MFDLTLTDSQRQICSALKTLHEPSAVGPKNISLQFIEGGKGSVFATADANDIAAPIAHVIANALDGWQNVPPYWREAHQAVHTRMTAYLTELDLLAGQLAREGIRLVALKNGGIARGIYPCAGCCPMGDLDVLVERHNFRRTHQLLLDFGYHFEFRSDLEQADLAAAERSGSAEYCKELSGGATLWLELQWRAVAGRWIRPDQEPSADDLMTRSMAIAGTAVRLLAPEDNLLQVALHTAKHSYVRAPGLRLHLDVERIVRGYPNLDWDRFVKEAIGLQVRTPVYFSLAIPHLILNTPIPRQVLAQLRPPAWKERLLAQQIQRAGLFDPNESKFTKAEYILFTSLLYDDVAGLTRGIIPDPAWMSDHYNVRHDALLPYYYGRRLFDLALRRTKT